MNSTASGTTPYRPTNNLLEALIYPQALKPHSYHDKAASGARSLPHHKAVGNASLPPCCHGWATSLPHAHLSETVRGGRTSTVMARLVRIGVKISLEFAAIGSDLRIDANFLDNVSTMA